MRKGQRTWPQPPNPKRRPNCLQGTENGNVDFAPKHGSDRALRAASSLSWRERIPEEPEGTPGLRRSVFLDVPDVWLRPSWARIGMPAAGSGEGDGGQRGRRDNVFPARAVHTKRGGPYPPLACLARTVPTLWPPTSPAPRSTAAQAKEQHGDREQPPNVRQGDEEGNDRDPHQERPDPVVPQSGPGGVED